MAAVVAGVLALASPAAGRRHRLQLPSQALPRALAVDESEWKLQPSRRVVGAGPIRIHVYNRGEDDHDLQVIDRGGAVHRVGVRSGADAILAPNLTPGTYRFICSLEAGTPGSHEARGMWFTLEVR